MKKSDIQKKAEKLMKEQKVDTVHATSDGQLFLEKNSAELHRDTNAKGAKLTVFTFGAGAAVVDNEPEIVPPLKPNQHNVNEVSIPEFAGLSTEALVAKIAEVEDPTVLTVLQASEDNGEKRASVLEAIGHRNAQLVGSMATNSGTAETIKAKAEKPEDNSVETPLQISARETRELKEKIASVNNVKELDAIEAEENKREKPRKSIVAAIGKRNAELTDAAKTDNQRKADDK